MLALLLAVPVTGSGAPQSFGRFDAMRAMARTAGNNLVAHVAPETGAYDFIDATGSAVLAADDASREPEVRARGFLERYGAVLGMTTNERRGGAGVFRVRDVYRDPAGNEHVRLNQIHRGIAVFGGAVVVHMNARGITGVSGTFVPTAGLARDARVSSSRARRTALNAVAKAYATSKLAVETTKPAIYRSGLIEGRPGETRLAHEVVVTGPHIRDQVMVDATTGLLLLRMEQIHTARDRIAYSPEYDPHNPDMFALRREGDPDTHIPPVDNLFRFSGQVYDLFANAFGRDSYDNRGHTMRTVYLINENCPNAYWNGSTTNYCPAFDLDDVVAHEWGHAYTEYTHGLVYRCEPGALNESYSDIWGETVDLLNGEDGIGGSNNDQPYPDGQRWIVGEDFGPAQEVLLRDMWDPARLGSPGKVSDEEFWCDPLGDSGGVHFNSGIPNHGYAMLVDGKTYNGRTVRGIGLNKAAHIYYQAMLAYQTPTTKFGGHARALQASCDDLAGVNLKALVSGQPSGERIGSSDCAQVASMIAATEMMKAPVQCAFEPLLSPEPQPICPAAQVVLNETWESGTDGWTFGHEGVTEDFPNFDWLLRAGLPDGRKGHAAFAPDVNGGVCGESAGDWSGQFWMDSPEVTIPQSAPDLTLRFDHWVGTEGVDGGNVAASINGGDFALLDTYTFNEPNGTIPTLVPDLANNTNPKAGEVAWFTGDPGEVTGSWGTTLADLSEVVAPGDRIRLRFDFGIDGCGGVIGWYVDDIAIYSCPELPLPELSVSGYSDPDPDRSVTFNWTRPGGAVGPDEIQRSRLGELTLLSDDAESGTDGWTITTNGVGILGWQTSELKANSGLSSFAARAVDPLIAGESILELDKPIVVPKRGETTLEWFDWYASEGDDAAIVDIHDGKSWVVVKKQVKAVGAQESAPGFLQDPFESQKIDLGRFAGKPVRLRFRYTVGAENRARSTSIFGWHVDDIVVRTALWETVSKPRAALARVANLVDGKHFFRVRTAYRTGFGTITPGPWSKPASVTVKGKTAVEGSKDGRRTLPATGVGAPGIALILFLVAAGGVRVLRRT